MVDRPRPVSIENHRTNPRNVALVGKSAGKIQNSFLEERTIAL
ncbi:hypothetical protein V0288_24250 [Pannus brasiliensis CCIBt3594]|uniref:Uncharacterized protein n=1 Tax=Pannus brasiliensis CCIBt3594 TaxID=1427578 RepID=A0AAW9QYE1_9CHRO